MIKTLNFALGALFVGGLVSCGGGEPTDEPTGPGFLGEDVTALNSQYMELTAAGAANATYQWQQSAGEAATIIDGVDSSTLRFLTPANVSAGQSISFTVERVEGSTVTSDTIDVILSPCDAAQGDIFIDCVAPGFGALRSYEQENDNPEGYKDGVYFKGEGDRHLVWRLVETLDPEHQTVIEIDFGANDPLGEIETNAWFGVGAPDDLGPPSTNRVDLTAYAGGAISFDFRQLNGEGAQIDAGMECGWPCSSERKMALAQTEWQTMTIAIDDLVESGADISQLDMVFMFSEQWWAQGAHSFQLDNIRLSQTYQEPVIDEPAHPGMALSLNLLDETTNIMVGAGTAGLSLSADENGYTIDYTSEGGYTWFFSQFVTAENNIGFVDLTDYFHGELVLEYTVNSWGADTDGEFVINAWCGAGCGLFPNIPLPRADVGVRTEFRVTIAEMVKRGLDLSNVGRIFNFKLRNSTPEGISIIIHSVNIELQAE